MADVVVVFMAEVGYERERGDQDFVFLDPGEFGFGPEGGKEFGFVFRVNGGSVDVDAFAVGQAGPPVVDPVLQVA